MAPPHGGLITCSCAGVKHEVALRGGAAVRQGHLAAIKHEAGLHAITDVILNFSTTASHLSRISQALQPAASSTPQSSLAVTVKDRTGVVLDIFKKHASSAEAHLQVRLAGAHHAACTCARRRLPPPQPDTPNLSQLPQVVAHKIRLDSQCFSMYAC